MKRWWMLGILCLIVPIQLWAQGGLPFFRNFTSSSYGAHARNFDVVSDENGRVYVANFEGLLYSDQSGWHIIHAPGVYRITKLYRDGEGKIWVGGYNLFGYLEASKPNGVLRLQLVFSQDSKGFLGEVTDIREVEGRMYVETSIGNITIEDDSMNGFVVESKRDLLPQYYGGALVNQRLELPYGVTLLATSGRGLVALNQQGQELYQLSEQNGLCNNNVNHIYADSKGYVWGATDNGLFCVHVSSSFTHFGASEGLLGEVQSICTANGHLYVGTLQGVFKGQGKCFHRVEGMNHACWQLQAGESGVVYAATAAGLYCIGDKGVKQLSTAHSLSFQINSDGSSYTGEVDGIYKVTSDEHLLLNKVEKATHFFLDGKGSLLVRNIFGQVFRLSEDRTQYHHVVPVNAEGQEARYSNLLYRQDGVLYVQSHVGLFRWNEEQLELEEILYQTDARNETLFSPFIYPEQGGRLWLTDPEGKGLRLIHRREMDEDLVRDNLQLYPIHDLMVSTLMTQGKQAWLGGSFGLIHWKMDYSEPDYRARNRVYIRRIVLDQDSIYWGGFSEGNSLGVNLPNRRYDFDSNTQNISISFSSDAFSTLGGLEYRYRLDKGDEWSTWSTSTRAHYANPRPGKYTFEVMGRDRYGRELEPASFTLYVHYPFYLRWYSVLGYVFALGGLVAWIIRWRMHRLMAEKMRLERIVEERTSQIRCQKDEIEQKSKKLEVALEDLNKAQFQLIRQEKMATVGTLTKGLVDRILNPMNYVNNFSHLSQGLVKDVRDNLDEGKEQFPEDLYDDSIDVLDMLDSNLKKIEEHGLNTTRILKAMEEMLRERKAVFQPIDIAAVCRKNIEMLHTYYAQEIKNCQIQVDSPLQDILLVAEVDVEQFSRTVMSILANSIYALQKKYQRAPFDARLSLKVGIDETKHFAEVKVYDNGVGIEEGILDKVFDPFFTTKTTTEAVGVGMYLSREIILNHGGDITVRSVKDQFAEFTICVPIHHR